MAQNDVRYFNTITIPTHLRDNPLREQAKLLHDWHYKAMECMARISAPNGEVYRKRASRSATTRRNATFNEWQARYETNLVPERQSAMLYDLYVEYQIIAQYIVNNSKRGRRMSKASRQRWVADLWRSMYTNPQRHERHMPSIQQAYERAMSRMELSHGRPTYYGVYEFHNDDKTLHVHSLSDIWLSHYATHYAIYGAKIVKDRMKKLQQGIYVPLPFDSVYLCYDITKRKRANRLSRIAGIEFEEDEVDEPTENCIPHLMSYITKKLEYTAKDITGTMSTLDIRQPDFYSANIDAREDDDEESDVVKLGEPIKVTLPTFRLDLPDHLDEGETWRDVIQRQLNQYPSDFETVHIHDTAIGYVTYIEDFFPLDNHAEFRRLKTNTEQLSIREQSRLKRLNAQAARELENLRVSFLTPKLLNRFTVPMLDMPPFETLIEWNLDEAQFQLILDYCFNPVTLAHGRAGTGKSRTVAILIKALQLPPEQTLIVAFTGKACARLNELFTTFDLPHRAKTIHSALAARYGNKFGHDEMRTLNNIRYVIVDEIGIVQKSLFAQLLRALPYDARLLLLGDYRQLPPIQGGSVLRELMDLGTIPTIELTELHRSQDKVLQFADAVLSNNTSKLTKITEGYTIDAVEQAYKDGWTILSNATEIVRKVNLQFESENGTKLGDYCYTVDDPVIQEHNDNKAGTLNGQMGRVVQQAPNEITVELDDGRNERYTIHNASKLSLAYALTIHKSQGSEFERVLVVLDLTDGAELSNELIYTAITRARYDVRMMLTPRPNNLHETWRMILERRAVMSDAHNYSNAERVAKWMLYQVAHKSSKSLSS
ncbi:ATP-dependent DNA helicase [Alicyclobacillus fastidiosus]|uniref:ATP-dependent RecD-like DNA helicase n=1 Tax=Alicyclobacillus fastidiosus TaxID=392011 RepID=A0ABV5AJC2_9BACL|nr:ATP-dependent RecD-like DNA helicase [Alicyclobacillus fastidiosus]WEH09121.1 ATP-dependent RecD-like DNA helicase [Alicyclobacillus fastidiosus]